MVILINVADIPPPSSGKTYRLKGNFSYHHYLCDGYDDRGWGCGYRTLQTICSWIVENNENYSKQSVPDILSIQRTLVDLEDKPVSFIGSKDWIGSVEIGLVIDQLFNIPCKILHINSGREIKEKIHTLIDHFNDCFCLLMMGGNADCSSKGIAGVHVNTNGEIFFLIVDPHYTGNPKTVKLLQCHGWIKWLSINELLDCSFYNICLPQVKITR